MESVEFPIIIPLNVPIMTLTSRLLFLLCLFTPVLFSCDDYTCQEASEEVEAATMAYTAAIDNGGDGMTECQALRDAMEMLIADSSCPEDAKDATRDLLDALDCN